MLARARYARTVRPYLGWRGVWVTREFVARVEALYVRVRVTDAVGDTHERIGDCMKGTRGDCLVAPRLTAPRLSAGALRAACGPPDE